MERMLILINLVLLPNVSGEVNQCRRCVDISRSRELYGFHGTADACVHAAHDLVFEGNEGDDAQPTPTSIFWISSSPALQWCCPLLPSRLPTLPAGHGLFLVNARRQFAAEHLHIPSQRPMPLQIQDHFRAQSLVSNLRTWLPLGALPAGKGMPHV